MGNIFSDTASAAQSNISNAFSNPLGAIAASQGPLGWAGPAGNTISQYTGIPNITGQNVLAGTPLGALTNPNKGVNYTAVAPNAPTSQFNQAKIQEPFSAQNLQQQYNQQQAQGGQQQQLANMLMQQAQGGGPNPALAQLSQATSQNIKNQAALMGSARGASQNMGQASMNAANIGSQVQQQSAMQAAQLQAQQQLAAEGALQGQQNMMGQLGLGQQNITAGMLGQQNQANVAMTQQQNAILAAQAQMGTQGQIAAMQANAAMATQNAAAQAQMLGGAIAGGAMVAPYFAAKGGMVPSKKQRNYYEGDFVNPDPTGEAQLGSQAGFNYKGALSSFGQSFGKSMRGTQPSIYNGMVNAGEAIGKMYQKRQQADDQDLMNSLDTNPFGVDASGGGGSGPKNMAMIEPQYSGGTVGSKLKSGGNVPGKAKVKGDSLKNDTIHAKLSPGEIVIPRTVVNSRDPVKNSAKFVAAILARKGR